VEVLLLISLGTFLCRADKDGNVENAASSSCLLNHQTPDQPTISVVKWRSRKPDVMDWSRYFHARCLLVWGEKVCHLINKIPLFSPTLDPS
jgi:hypothetical protein